MTLRCWFEFDQLFSPYHHFDNAFCDNTFILILKLDETSAAGLGSTPDPIAPPYRLGAPASRAAA
jgi:hypothetical protein